MKSSNMIAGKERLPVKVQGKGIHRVKLRHRVYGHDTIAILWVQHDGMRVELNG